MGRACRIAAYASCRYVLETFGQNFVKLRRRKYNQKVCKYDLSATSTMTDIFKHFDECINVTNDNKLLLGDKMSNSLEASGYKLSTVGSFAAAIYSILSNAIHQADILRDKDARVAVLFDIPPVEKRFLDPLSLGKRRRSCNSRSGRCLQKANIVRYTNTRAIAPFI